MFEKQDECVVLWTGNLYNVCLPFNSVILLLSVYVYSTSRCLYECTHTVYPEKVNVYLYVCINNYSVHGGRSTCVLQAFKYVFLCTRVCSSIHIYIRVWVCVSAKCHIDRLIAVVSDSVTLWLVDSSLIHTPSWVIGPAHWFPACQPSQEELGGRKRACRYWLAPDQPHHLLPTTHTHTKPNCSPTACSLAIPSVSFLLHYYSSPPATYPPSVSLLVDRWVYLCHVMVSSPSVSFFFFFFGVKYFYWQILWVVGGI